MLLGSPLHRRLKTSGGGACEVVSLKNFPIEPSGVQAQTAMRHPASARAISSSIASGANMHEHRDHGVKARVVEGQLLRVPFDPFDIDLGVRGRLRPSSSEPG